MNKFASLLISTLLLGSSSAWASANPGEDLRHCLDLQSNIEIAQCAGELTPGKAGARLARKEAPVNAAAKEAAAGEVAKTDSELFRAHVLIVKSHDDIENWVKLGAEQRKADVANLREVSRGEKIYFPVIAAFAASQEGKKIALVAELEIVTPEGKVNKLKLEGSQTCCTADMADPRAPATVVLQPVIEFTFDATDLSGKYKVRARLSNGKQTMVAEETFSLM